MRFALYLVLFCTLSTLNAKPLLNNSTFENIQFFMGIDYGVFDNYKRSVDKTYSVNENRSLRERYSYEAIGHPVSLQLGVVLYKHHKIYISHTFTSNHKRVNADMYLGNSVVGYDYLKKLNNEFSIYIGVGLSKILDPNQNKRLFAKYYTTDIILLLDLGILYHLSKDVDLDLSYQQGLWQYEYKHYINDKYNDIKNGFYHYDALMDYSTLKLGVVLNF